MVWPKGDTRVKIDAVIFDLDGTLVDSADGIINSYAGAFQSCGVTPTRNLTSDVIGPPLLPTLNSLAGTNDAVVIDPLAAAFRAYYDEIGFRATKIYHGVSEMLQLLEQDPRPVFVATNKRKKPTDAIMGMLNWSRHFQEVYALDSLCPPALTKGALLGYILSNYKLQPEHTLYVGDREEDFLAATEVGVQFYRATWGYGDCSIYESADGGIKKLMALLNIVTEN
jgi:phosphoglycolate phosphatase